MAFAPLRACRPRPQSLVEGLDTRREFPRDGRHPQPISYPWRPRPARREVLASSGKTGNDGRFARLDTLQEKCMPWQPAGVTRALGLVAVQSAEHRAPSAERRDGVAVPPQGSRRVFLYVLSFCDAVTVSHRQRRQRGQIPTNRSSTPPPPPPPPPPPRLQGRAP